MRTGDLQGTKSNWVAQGITHTYTHVWKYIQMETRICEIKEMKNPRYTHLNR